MLFFVRFYIEDELILEQELAPISELAVILADPYAIGKFVASYH